MRAGVPSKREAAGWRGTSPPRKRPSHQGEIVMKRYVSLAVLGVLFAWTGAVLAQEAVTIKLKEKGEGDAALIEKTETGTVAKKITVQGNTMEDTQKMSETTAYKETILKVDDKKHAT